MTQHELMAAVSGENIESVKLSLERGADINLQDRMKLAVGIVTARDDQRMIYKWLREHVGFKIDKDLIFAVNDPIHKFKGGISDRKKAAFIELMELGYTDFQFYDDDTANLKLVKSLESEYEGISISTIKARK